jgi:hypothetical protein
LKNTLDYRQFLFALDLVWLLFNTKGWINVDGRAEVILKPDNVRYLDIHETDLTFQEINPKKFDLVKSVNVVVGVMPKEMLPYLDGEKHNTNFFISKAVWDQKQFLSLRWFITTQQEVLKNVQFEIDPFSDPFRIMIYGEGQRVFATLLKACATEQITVEMVVVR